MVKRDTYSWVKVWQWCLPVYDGDRLICAAQWSEVCRTQYPEEAEFIRRLYAKAYPGLHYRVQVEMPTDAPDMTPNYVYAKGGVK